MELQYPAGTTLIAAQHLLCEDNPLGAVNGGICQRDLLCLFQRHEQRFLVLFKDHSEDRVNAIGPLCPSVVEHEEVVRGFDPAAHEFFFREYDLFRAARIAYGDFFCFTYIDVVFGIDHLTRLCVDFVAVLILCRIEFQLPAGSALIAAQLLPCEDDLHFGRRFADAGVLQGNSSCFLQGYEQRGFVFGKYVAVYRVNAVCPLRITVAEHKAVEGISDSLVNQPCLGKCNP